MWTTPSWCCHPTPAPSSAEAADVPSKPCEAVRRSSWPGSWPPASSRAAVVRTNVERQRRCRPSPVTRGPRRARPPRPPRHPPSGPRRHRARSHHRGWGPGCCPRPTPGSVRSAARRRPCGTGGSPSPTPCAPCPASDFAARVTAPAPRPVIARSTWRPRCPVEPAELTWLRLAFWGFDDRRHTGELLVHADVARDLVSVFRRLYAARFPLEELSIITRRRARRTPDRRRERDDGVRLPPHDRRNDVLPARLRPGGRREQLPEPLRLRRSGAAGARERLPAADMESSGHDRGQRPGGAGVRLDRVGMGRLVAVAEGLPALQPERQLIPTAAASAAAAPRP